MSSPWKTVSLSRGTPQLLMKTRFDRTGYDIQLTDLSRIWRETLSKEEIITRAIESGCSFNPGDDDGNYNTFLKCIVSALNGEAKTASTLHPSDGGTLSLDLSVTLPEGLSDLKWTIELVQQSDSAVASEIVGPLLLQADSMRTQIQQLVDEIAAKDHVISKITDRFETGAIDLTAVFPGASNVKTSKKRLQSQRSQLAGHVKGLADFDRAAWEASNEKLHEAQELTPDVMNTVLQSLPLPGRNDPGIDGWVGMLASRSQGSSLVHIKPKSSSENTDSSTPETQDDGFERMETPPHLSKRIEAEQDPIPGAEVAHGIKTDPNDEYSETDDEDCLDVPPTASQQQAWSTIEHSDSTDEKSQKTTAMTNGTPELEPRASAISVKPPQVNLTEETAASVSPPPASKSHVKAEKDDTESAVESEKRPRIGGLGRFGGRKSKDEPVAGEEAEPNPVKPKSTLGRFGGKKSQPTPDPISAAASPPKPRSTLGRFGGKSKATSADPPARRDEVDESPSHGGGSTKASATPSRRQVSEVPPERELTEEEKQQRADEKREKLKRELDAKAKAPVKKKRKF